MKQVIYAMLAAVSAAVVVTPAHSQTRTKDQFRTEPIARVQTSMVKAKPMVSPRSPQELRALIFENYTPQDVSLKRAMSAKTPTGAAAERLPSDSPAEETAKAAEAVPPKHTPPTQGVEKEVQ